MTLRLQFDGDVVIVTGAGGGMGRVHALELARRGARVVVNDLGGHPSGVGADPSLAEAVVEEIRDFGGEAVVNTESVATPEGAASLTEMAIKQWGRLDAVVANAAISRNLPFDELTVEDFDDVLAVDLRGVFLTVQPAYKAMKAAGGGRILGVASTAGLLGNANQANYAAAKGGVVALIRTVAIEGERHGMKANVLTPGALWGRSHTRLVEEYQAASRSGTSAANVPLAISNPEQFPRLTPDRVTPMVTLLVHEACPCTGQILSAWGGLYQQPTVTVNDGWVCGDDVATVEDVLAHWDEITDQTTAEDPGLDAFLHGAQSYERFLVTRSKVSATSASGSSTPKGSRP